LKGTGFIPAAGDMSLFAANAVYLLAYVDDLLIAGNLSAVAKTKEEIAAKFSSVDLGEAGLFLGMRTIRDRTSKTLWVGQPHYAQEILQRFGMENARTRRTPIDPNLVLFKGSGEIDDKIRDKYQELIGCLLYLMCCTRPDLAHSVGLLSRSMSAPTAEHYNAAMRVLKYLAKYPKHGLKYKAGLNR
jgi:Reverse transcriptase (RNA-dependent DNA polymerase)